MYHRNLSNCFQHWTFLQHNVRESSKYLQLVGQGVDPTSQQWRKLIELVCLFSHPLYWWPHGNNFRCSWRNPLLTFMTNAGLSGIMRWPIYAIRTSGPSAARKIPKIRSVEVLPTSQFLCCMCFFAVHPCLIDCIDHMTFLPIGIAAVDAQCQLSSTWKS